MRSGARRTVVYGSTISVFYISVSTISVFYCLPFPYFTVYHFRVYLAAIFFLFSAKYLISFQTTTLKRGAPVVWEQDYQKMKNAEKVRHQVVQLLRHSGHVLCINCTTLHHSCRTSSAKNKTSWYHTLASTRYSVYANINNLAIIATVDQSLFV